MLILVCSQECYTVNIWPGDLDLWPRKSIGFQILLKNKYVPSLVKIHWRMLILECLQGCYMVKIWPGNLDLWPWKSIGFQILLRSKYVPSLVKIHWRMLILECSQGCYGRTRYYIPSQLSWRGDKNWRPFKHVHVPDCLHNSLYCLTTEESCILYMTTYGWRSCRATEAVCW